MQKTGLEKLVRWGDANAADADADGMVMAVMMILMNMTARYEEDKLLEKRRRKLEREEKQAAIKEKNKRQA